MNRLTRKSNREYYESHIRSVDDNYSYEQFLQDRPYTLNHVYCVEYETKLGKLEDIEEELGCPLEIVFKALKQGYIYVYDNHYNFDNYTKTTAKITFNNNKFYIGFARLIRRLEDYQKTWWLKGEKDELIK